MNLTVIFRFALKQLNREWKSGHLWVLALALITAIASHTAIGHFSDRIGRAINNNANNLIAGDLIVSSYRPFAQNVYDTAAAQNVEIAQKRSFTTMSSANDAFLLASVTAVDDPYPLKGDIKISDALFDPAYAVTAPPKNGEAWLDARIANHLQIEIGDNITIGEKQLRFSKVLIQTLDSSGGFYNLTPRIMINIGDLDATGIVQPGSRVQYQLMFAGSDDNIENLRSALAPLLETGEKLRGIGEERPGIAEALDKANQYTGLASLVALLLAAVAVASSGRHYIQRHFDTSALMRCLGATQSNTLASFMVQLCLIALICGILGNLLGYAISQGFMWLIGDLLPKNVPGARMSTVYSGMFLSFVMLLGFTLPSLIRLKNVSPSKVLRNDIIPLPLSSWLTYGGAILLIVLLMWVYTNNLILTLSVIFGALVVFGLSIVMVVLLFKLLNKVLPILPISMRPGMRNFLRRSWTTSAQTIAFGLTIMALMLIFFIRTNLLETWQTSLPDDAPNHFVINLQDSDTNAYERFLENANIQFEPIFPVVRGRLTHINSKPVNEVVSKENRDHESIRRELNFTWSQDIPQDNELTRGTWWPENESEPVVSIEAEIAEDLGIELNDTLTFVTGAEQWKARVTSVREVDWGNFKPNFYMVFNQPTLQDLPRTWIHSFYLPEQQKQELSELVKQFPSISLVELDTVLSQVKTIINQVTWVVQALLLFVLLAAFSVTLSELKSSLYERIKEGAIVRTLGASTKQLRSAQWTEFAAIGVFSAFVAMIGTEIVNRIIYARLFEIEYHTNILIWIAVIILSALVIGFLGVYNGRDVIKNSPLTSLRG